MRPDEGLDVGTSQACWFHAHHHAASPSQTPHRDHMRRLNVRRPYMYFKSSSYAPSPWDSIPLTHRCRFGSLSTPAESYLPLGTSACSHTAVELSSPHKYSFRSTVMALPVESATQPSMVSHSLCRAKGSLSRVASRSNLIMSCLRLDHAREVHVVLEGQPSSWHRHQQWPRPVTELHIGRSCLHPMSSDTREALVLDARPTKASGVRISASAESHFCTPWDQ